MHICIHALNAKKISWALGTSMFLPLLLKLASQNPALWCHKRCLEVVLGSLPLLYTRTLLTWHDMTKQKLQIKSLISKNLQKLRFCSAFSIRSSINGLPKWSMITKISGYSFNNSAALWNWCLQWVFGWQSPHEIHRKIVEDGGVWHTYTQPINASASHIISLSCSLSFSISCSWSLFLSSCDTSYIYIKIYIINAIHASNLSVCNTSILYVISFDFNALLPRLPSQLSRAFVSRHGLSCMSKLRL